MPALDQLRYQNKTWTAQIMKIGLSERESDLQHRKSDRMNNPGKTEMKKERIPRKRFS